MTTSRKLTSILLALFALVVMSASALAADPGLVYPPTSEVSDQKAGSVLFYNYYTSGATSGATQNTRVNITNTSSTSAVAVHLFFVDAVTCQPADSFICLTPNQTASFLASDVDPGTTGYIVAVASDSIGCPVAFNFLIGDEYFKTTTGHAANLGAEAFAALYLNYAGCDANSTTAALVFNGVQAVNGNGYNQAPRVLALSNFASRADGNDTLLIINRVGGNLAIGAAAIGALFGLVYDDAENPGSFTFSSNRCQFQSSINFRTAPPLSSLVPAGRSGWLKFFSQADIALLGAAVNHNGNQDGGGFEGGHNLHKLTLAASTTLTIPIFPPNC